MREKKVMNRNGLEDVLDLWVCMCGMLWKRQCRCSKCLCVGLEASQAAAAAAMAEGLWVVDKLEVSIGHVSNQAFDQ